MHRHHPRFSQQCSRIMDAFYHATGHRLTGRQLMEIAPRFGARLHEMRKAGYRIKLVRYDRATGFTVYQIGGRP